MGNQVPVQKSAQGYEDHYFRHIAGKKIILFAGSWVLL